MSKKITRHLENANQNHELAPYQSKNEYLVKAKDNK
jgi:hypothetical protein